LPPTFRSNIFFKGKKFCLDALIGLDLGFVAVRFCGKLLTMMIYDETGILFKAVGIIDTLKIISEA
jgi:hypothetical protein